MKKIALFLGASCLYFGMGLDRQYLKPAAANELVNPVRNRQLLIGQIQPDEITIDVGHGTSFNYNAIEGTGIFFDKGTRQIIQQSAGYRRTWDSIAYLGDDLMLFYDARAGEGEIYAVNQRRGEIVRLRKYIDFRRTWDQIFSESPGEVTLIDINGETETYLVHPDGEMEEIDTTLEESEEND